MEGPKANIIRSLGQGEGCENPEEAAQPSPFPTNTARTPLRPRALLLPQDEGRRPCQDEGGEGEEQEGVPPAPG